MTHQSIEPFLEELRGWAAQQADILAVAISGSHARGTALPSSDIDVIIIAEDPLKYLGASAWVDRFGHAESITHEDWGLLQAKRVFFSDGKEVEFGIASRGWAGTKPVDAGTKEVVSSGIRIL